jgi:tetratricopeptide (TPR) repeat protein
MNRTIAIALAVASFATGTGLATAAPKPRADASMYHGRDATEAGRALLDIALKQAGKGSWERIGVGRAYYLGGFRPEGQAIFDALLNGKPDDSDVYRIARVYQEAGEWDRAKALFDRYLASNPEDEKALAEIGAYTLLHGDRARAEQLFDRSFQASPDEVWATLAAADAYLNVKPEE